MKKETDRKGRKRIWFVSVFAALLVIFGVVLAVFLLVGEPAQTTQPQDGALYWNADRSQYMDAASGMSVREPDGEGLFHVRFAYNGQLVEYSCADKQLINYIDSMDAMGLVLDSDGVIVDVLDPKSIATEIASNFFVKSVDGDTAVINSSIAMNGMDITLTFTDKLHIYDVRPGSETLAQEMPLEQFDFVKVYGDSNGEATHVYIMERTEKAAVYWRLDQQYSTVTQRSLRTADENGVYTIPFAHEGQQIELKCKDQELVSQIDAASVPEIGLRLDTEGYITEVLPVGKAIHGMQVCNSYNVTELSGSSFTAVRQLPSQTGSTFSGAISDDCDIFLMENGCEAEFIGQRAEGLKLGDMIRCYTDLQGKPILIFIIRRTADYPMYYNLERKYGANGTTRQPDKDGYYVFEMVGPGQAVTVRTKDKALADRIDAPTTQSVGLKLDGTLIEKVYHANCICGAWAAGENRYVTGISGTVVSLAITQNFLNVSSFVLGEGCQIYDATGHYGVPLGSETTLQLSDRVMAFRNPSGEITHAFVISRYAPNAKVYYNVTRMYNTTKKETTRTPDAQGYYVFQMCSGGKEVTVKTKSKAMASYIDRQYSPVVALEVKNGIVKKAYPAADAEQYGAKTLNYNYITDISKDGALTISYYTGGKWTTRPNVYRLAEDCEIYNVSEYYQKNRGEKTTLKVNDRIQAIRTNEDGKLVQVWVLERYNPQMGIYYNITPMYDKEKGETTRVPDADGYYSFKMCCNDRQLTVRTKDKQIASFIDAQKAPIVALAVKDGIVQAAYPAYLAVQGGYKQLNYNYVDKIENGKITAYYYSGGKRVYRDTTFKIAENCKVYNVSDNYERYRGEATKLQPGDQIQGIASKPTGEITQIFVLSREVDAPLYWKVDRKYNSTTGETTRIPNAEGYYVFDLAVDGTIKQFKTKDKAVASKVDQYSQAFTLKTKGDIIQQAFSWTDAKGIEKITAGNADVMELGENTATAVRNYPAASNYGQSFDVTFAKNCKFYNVSDYAASFGAVQKPGLGDRIACYADVDGKVLYCYIAYEHTRKEGHISLCSHCDQEVFWEPYTGGIHKTNTHYYLTHDMQRSGQVTVGSADADRTPIEAVLDLNGKTLTSGKRSFLVYDTLSILDSVGGGKIEAAGMEGAYGGNILVMGGTLKLYSGTLAACEDSAAIARGGIVAVEGKGSFLMYGGTVAGGKANIGGNISVNGGVLTLDGGTVTGGTANYGGNVYIFGSYSADAAAFTMNGGTVCNGVAGNRGGNIYSTAASTVMTINGGSVTGGTAQEYHGGNILLAAKMTLNVTGGEISGGTAVYMGGNIAVPGVAATVNISGGKIYGGTGSNGADITVHGTTADPAALNISGGSVDGGFMVYNTAKLTLSGAPRITGDGIYLRDNGRLILGQLTEGAAVTVSNTGAFTEESDQAQAYAKYFAATSRVQRIVCKDKVLYSEADYLSSLEFDEGTLEAVCPVCVQKVQWTPITGTESYVALSGQHYYLPQDVSVNASGNGKEAYLYLSGAATLGDVCLHLNGHDLTVTGHRAIISGVRPLNIMGSGRVSGEVSKASGSAVHVNTGKGAGQVNLYGGTYTKAAADTVGSIVYIGVNGGTVNMYDGAVIDGTGLTSGGNSTNVMLLGGTGTSVSGNAVFNLYGGVIKNGTTTESGGNISLTTKYASLNISGGQILDGKADKNGGNIASTGGVITVTGGVITGGSAAGKGGNLYAVGTSVNDRVTLSLNGGQIGSPDGTQTEEARKWGGISGSEGGNVYADYAKLRMEKVLLQGGKAGSHGGNLSIQRSSVTIQEGTQITGGYTAAQGGSLRLYQSTVYMNGGTVSGGQCATQATHNIWLAGTKAAPCVMYFNGGTVHATAGTQQAGTGINAFQYATLYMNRTGTVIDDPTSTGAGVAVSANSKICFCSGWSGSVSIKWPDKYAPGAVIPTTLAQVVTLDSKLNTTPGGTITGTLWQQNEGALELIAQSDGTVQVKAEE